VLEKFSYKRSCLLPCGFGHDSHVAPDSYVTSFRIVRDGMRFRVPPKGHGYVKWEEVQTVSFSEPLGWFVIQTSDGRTIRVTSRLYGMENMAEALLANVPRSHFETRAHSVLADRASGHPPAPAR
jgi:hypothetical protein